MKTIITTVAFILIFIFGYEMGIDAERLNEVEIEYETQHQVIKDRIEMTKVILGMDSVLWENRRNELRKTIQAKMNKYVCN